MWSWSALYDYYIQCGVKPEWAYALVYNSNNPMKLFELFMGIKDAE